MYKPTKLCTNYLMKMKSTTAVREVNMVIKLMPKNRETPSQYNAIRAVVKHITSSIFIIQATSMLSCQLSSLRAWDLDSQALSCRTIWMTRGGRCSGITLGAWRRL